MTDEFYEKCTALVYRFERAQRAKHSFGVYKEACGICDLAGIGGRERDDIAAAALLHDLAHDMPLEKQYEIMDAAGVDYGDIKAYPTVVHQRAGAVLAKRELPLLSDESCRIIECHTTGKVGMTTGEKIVCLGDFIEPGREYAGCRAVREYFYSKAEKITDTEQLDRVIGESLREEFGITLDHLKKKGYPIHPTTVAVYGILCSEYGKRVIFLK